MAGSRWTAVTNRSTLFANEERAGVFTRALKKLHLHLEQKIEAQIQPHWRLSGFSTHNESAANLSRISLTFND